LEYYDNISEIVKNEFLKIPKDAKIIVSLSGGVDSIVALNIISKLTKNVIAVHINYDNRIESADELDFVNYYTNKLDIKLFYRTITEIKREQCLHNGLRDIYENITKKIRIDMYNRLADENTYVLLGHNKDDCFENIITNISSRKNYDNLSGMTTFTKTDKMILWRPMLNIYKDCIIETALLYNIPFLKDSTPSWSMRGKIRNTIKKDLISLKNDNDIIETFFELKNYLLESNNVINTVIIGDLISKLNYTYTPKLTNITVIYNKHEINCLKYYNICFIFFKKINISISSKTIKEFIYFIKKKKNTKIYINKNIYINKKFTSENENFLEFFINETN
jgi:tRNA(Ile)-lysidine synthetase-like protein